MKPNSNLHDGKLDSLVLDLVEWVAREPRSYAQVSDEELRQMLNPEGF